MFFSDLLLDSPDMSVFSITLHPENWYSAIVPRMTFALQGLFFWTGIVGRVKIKRESIIEPICFSIICSQASSESSVRQKYYWHVWVRNKYTCGLKGLALWNDFGLWANIYQCKKLSLRRIVNTHSWSLCSYFVWEKMLVGNIVDSKELVAADTYSYKVKLPEQPTKL